MVMETIIYDNFDEIKNILQEIDDSEVTISKRFNNIYFYNDKSEVYIKFNTKQVIISRIVLGDKRKGYCTKILNILIDYCKKYSIKQIMIESVLTDEMFNFCNKHNFIKEENKYSTGIHGNYLLEVK